MILFYKKENNYNALRSVELKSKIEGYSVEFWRPSFYNIIPKGFPRFPFYIWYLFHFLRIFRTKRYGILIIRSNNLIIHHSTATPSFFRFPDMKKNDLQIGNTFTLENFRGKGLAKIAIHHILEYANSFTHGDIWYLVDESNTASIKVIEAIGFNLIGKGIKKKGILPFISDKYMLTTHK